MNPLQQQVEAFNPPSLRTIDDDIRSGAKELASLMRDGDPDILKAQTIESYLMAFYLKGKMAQPIHLLKQAR